MLKLVVVNMPPSLDVLKVSINISAHHAACRAKFYR